MRLNGQVLPKAQHPLLLDALGAEYARAMPQVPADCFPLFDTRGMRMAMRP